MKIVFEALSTLHGVKCRIEANVNMTNATTLAINHGKSLKITVAKESDDANTPTLSSIREFGIKTMKDMHPVISRFVGLFREIYTQIFDKMVKQGKLKASEVESILRGNLSQFGQIDQYSDGVSTAISSLAQAIAQLKPTAKMEMMAHKGDETEDEREGKLIRSFIVLRLGIKMLEMVELNEIVSQNESLQAEKKAILFSKLKHFFSDEIFSDLSARSGDRATNILPVGKWQIAFEEAFEDIWQICISEGNRSSADVQNALKKRIIKAHLSLDRLGMRLMGHFRTDNIPSVPGLLVSFRVQRSGNSESVEIELCVSAGHRGAFEMVTGGTLVRVADR
jgi:hypothetical protein